MCPYEHLKITSYVCLFPLHSLLHVCWLPYIVSSLVPVMFGHSCSVNPCICYLVSVVGSTVEKKNWNLYHLVRLLKVIPWTIWKYSVSHNCMMDFNQWNYFLKLTWVNSWAMMKQKTVITLHLDFFKGWSLETTGSVSLLQLLMLFCYERKANCQTQPYWKLLLIILSVQWKKKKGCPRR